MISSQKARNIQMLEIGEPTFIEEKIIWACFHGKDSIMIPTDMLTDDQIEQMDKELRYNLKWHHDIKEWEISWARR